MTERWEAAAAERVNEWFAGWAFHDEHWLRFWNDYADAIAGLKTVYATALQSAYDAGHAAGFTDFGPLFHRDVCRVLGIPENSSLDATMAALRAREAQP